MRWLLLLGVVVAVAATLAITRPTSTSVVAHARGRTWPPLATARVFFYAELHEKVLGRWSAAYRSLYPAHKRVASRWAYVRCERATPFPAELRSLHIVSVRRSSVHVPGLRRKVPGVAVRTAIELTWYGPRDPIAFTYTFHLVPVHGRWTWLLSEHEYRLYTTSGCGLRPPA